MNDEPVYLDHAASTPMYAEAAAAMTRQLARIGNPSSLHASGRAARRVVEESREKIAQALNARPGEVVFPIAPGDGKRMRSWNLPFLIRHSAFHAMDHAWEMQDKDLTAPPE